MDLHYRKSLSVSVNKTQLCSFCNLTDDPSFCSDCLLYCGVNCSSKINGIPRSSPHHTLPAKYLISGLVLGVTVLVLFCLTIYYKFYTGPRRRSGEGRDGIHEDFLDEDHGPVHGPPVWFINTVGLQPSVINSITVCKYKKSDGLIEGTDCSVCLSEFQEDETLRLLPKCSHAFHVRCIDTWLRSHSNCPMCRAPIVVQSPAAAAATAAVITSSRESSSNGGEGEETRIEVLENNGETDAGNGGRDGELGIQVEERELEDENFRKRDGAEGIQPMGRSFSLDSLSDFKISQALANVHSMELDRNSDTELATENESSMEIAPKRVGSSNQALIKFMASSSIGRSLQIGPSSLERSVSCGGKLFSQRYSTNSSSVLPL